jgi:hypothetical protein
MEPFRSVIYPGPRTACSDSKVPAKNAEELPLGGVKMCGGFLAGGDQLGIDALSGLLPVLARNGSLQTSYLHSRSRPADKI